MKTNNLPVYVTDEELQAIDAHVGDGVRSHFIVQAIREKIRLEGGYFPDEVTDKIEIADDLTATQKRYAEMYNAGMNYSEIASELGVSRQAVSLALKKAKEG